MYGHLQAVLYTKGPPTGPWPRASTTLKMALGFGLEYLYKQFVYEKQAGTRQTEQEVWLLLDHIFFCFRC